MIATKKLRPPIKRHGGKAYLARRIVGLMPPHRVYCEPFLGGGSVLLNKIPAPIELAGDLDSDLINFWEVLAEKTDSLVAYLGGMTYSAGNFEAAKGFLDSMEDTLAAVGFIVRNRFSRGGLGKDFAWSDRLRGKNRPGGPVPGDVNAWDTIRAELPAIAERIKAVEFHCCDALQLIRSTDGPDTLHYLDPPYLHETRTARDCYDHEMDRGGHEALLDLIRGCRGRVMLSGYRSALYDDSLEGWRSVEFDMPNHAGQGKAKQRRVEVLWMNF